MTRKKVGVTLLATGLLVAALAIFFVVRAIMGFVEEMKPLAEVESGHTVTIHLEEPGPYTLWADDRPSSGLTVKTTTVTIPPSAAPPGSPAPTALSYSLTEQATGKSASYKPIGMSATRNYGSTSSKGLGVFDAPTAGKYEFTATDPSGKVPQFSLTAGEFGFGFIKQPLIMVLAILVGGLGIVMIIVGIILMALKPKTETAPPLSSAQS